MSQWRGRRPPEAENRAHIPRAIASREAMLWQGCSFSASLLRRKAPRSVLGGFAARVAPDLAGSPLETRSTHLRQTNTPQTATRARWHKQGQLLGEARHDQIGRGNGSPNLARWRNANARPNAPAPRISPSPKASPKGALAGVQRTIQPSLGITLALAPRRGGYQEITVIRKVGFVSSGRGRGGLRLMPVNIG